MPMLLTLHPNATTLHPNARLQHWVWALGVVVGWGGGRGLLAPMPGAAGAAAGGAPPPNPTHVLALPCGLQGLPASALSIAHLLDTRQAGGWVVVC